MITSHYDWLWKHLPVILERLGVRDIMGAITAEGDKCYSQEDKWNEIGIPFPHGVAMYILSKEPPWAFECRQTDNGWVNVYDWIAKTYPQLKQHFPTEDLEYWNTPRRNRR